MVEGGAGGLRNVDDVDDGARWPTGWLMIAGLLAGALAGLLLGFVPGGVAAGLALGVGLDSLLNHLVNERRWDQEGCRERRG